MAESIEKRIRGQATTVASAMMVAPDSDGPAEDE
jgi:hypothetical protein